jgi:hypothetical protein
MNEQLVKRSAETVLFDFDCSAILGANETITNITAVEGSGPGAALTFGTPRVNTSAISYGYNRQTPAGKVAQVLVGGGSVAGGASAAYVVKVRFETSNAGEVREAAARLLVTDEPWIPGA